MRSYPSPQGSTRNEKKFCDKAFHLIPKALKCSELSSSISYFRLPGPRLQYGPVDLRNILLSEHSLEYSLALVLSIFGTNCGTHNKVKIIDRNEQRFGDIVTPFSSSNAKT